MSTSYDLSEDLQRTRRRPDPHQGSGAAPGSAAHPLHALQRDAGNAAVVAGLQREEDDRSPVLDVVGRGGGRALSSALQRDMSARFGGTDFSGVRLHDDTPAKASAAAVGARAYTTGHEVVLGEGVNLASADGQRTLAHELTHVVQQRSGPVDGTATGEGLSVSDPTDRFEQQAEANADRVMSGGAPVLGQATGSDSSTQREVCGADSADQVTSVQREGPEVEEEEELMADSVQREQLPEGEQERELY